MNIVILTGGKGERLGKIAENTNKCLLEIFNGWSIIDFSIHNALLLPEPKIYVVLGHKGDLVRDHVSLWKTDKIQFREQLVPTTIGAIQSVEKDVQGDFLLMLGDEILVNPSLLSMSVYSYFNKDKFQGVIGYVSESDPKEIRKTYSIETDSEGYNITKLVEKPKIVNTTFKGTGNCILPKEFFDWAKQVQNYDVQDFVTAVQYGIDRGYIFRPFQVCEKYFNINTIEDYTRAKRYFRNGGEKG